MGSWRICRFAGAATISSERKELNSVARCSISRRDGYPHRRFASLGNPDPDESSSDNLTHQQPSSDNLAQFIRMLGNLSPADRQTLASALSSSLSPETDSDPLHSTKPAVKTLEPYDRLEEWLLSFKRRGEFFNHTKTHELEDYADDMATIQARLGHLTRPIDATVHAILASNPMDIEDPVLINTIEAFDILRYNLAFITTEITHLRKEAMYRDKKIISPAAPNDKTPLITHQQFIDQEKFTRSLRSISALL
ncbi:hypothetical protein K457DRAFT_25792 [Linnemannia elongata AG-77]|uniref:Uncharacterized protein n=1 Tax=Linnemannia elongata AG-77 TaxID=1314771 RepID=A0A197JCF8_9FUNG|nr:hypothetical protein K457DRAFT_25792 [Linnemannia elongata AG-77]